VGKLAGVPHLKAIRALERVGSRVIRQGKHVVMWNGRLRLTIPSGNPVDPYTMGGIIKDSGLTIEEFRKLL
jgi:predicted RNA binding protein YcfA (HicA-like mRNA interferase family)